MKQFNIKKLDERGSIILVFVIMIPFIIAITMYYMSESLTSFQVARFDQLHTEAQAAADAGADYSIEQLAQNNNWGGTGGEITLHSDSSLKTTYISTVSGNSSSKTIAVTGKTYWPANAVKANRSVSIYVDLYPVTTGNYSIVAGAGGLYMSNSAKVVGGSVFINGELSMSNSSQIGLSTNPVSVQSADELCPSPADATYPKVCSGGSAGPIVLNNSAHIYGQVTATNQTNGSGMTNPGLVAGSPAPLALPTYDRAGQKAAVANHMSGNNASCAHSQVVTWPANTEINGDVSMSQSCTVIIKGNVWITGNLSVNNTSSIVIDNSVGTTRPNIMVDGSGGISFNQGATVAANISGTGAEFYTFYCGSSCSEDTVSLTGTALASSRSISTITLSNSASAPNSIFYAYWSQLSMSNSGQIGAIIGQTIQMNNTATITFGASSGVNGNTTWVVKGYRRQ